MFKSKKMVGAMLVAATLVLSLALPQKALANGPACEDATNVELVDNREYVDLVIAQVDSYVNVRAEASEKSKILGKLYNNSVGHFIEEEGDWIKIKSGTVEGYVKGEYCVRGIEALKIAREVEITYAKINVSTLRVREKATTDSKILGTFSKGDELVVTAEEDGFAKVTYNNAEGFISMDYVDVHTEFVEAESIEEEKARKEAEEKAKKAAQAQAKAKLAAEKSNASIAAQAAAATANISASELGQQIVNFACQFVGNPYVYGGTSLTNGADCGGFVQSVYKNFGINLPRTGHRNCGYAIGSLDQAQPGDLVCYSGHVAIYMGGGQIVHAASPSEGITTGKATYAPILTIRRIF